MRDISLILGDTMEDINILEEYFETPLTFKGITYRTCLHFYTAMKIEINSYRIIVSELPLERLRDFVVSEHLFNNNWEVLRKGVMLYILRYNYSEANPTNRAWLKGTKGYWLQDNFWKGGEDYSKVCKDLGTEENALGSLLMYVRDEILEEDGEE